jgi:CRISPR-associated protein Csb2
MIHIELRFLTGRYHATPWGRHVNEGAVEWPPSPWRLLRAFVSTGFTKLGWGDVPPPARGLFEKLAGAPPVFHLPETTASHTRHYMPNNAKTDKVLDTFAWVGRGERDALVIEWPAILADDEAELLEELLTGLGYLGRAESLIQARRIEALPTGLARCAASEGPPGPGFERVPLLAPMTPEHLAAWKAEYEARPPGEPSRKEGARKGTRARKSKKGANGLPADLLGVLVADTGTLQKAGWSQPPGTRWLSYWQAEGQLSSMPAHRIAGSVRAMNADTALLALASDSVNREVLPRMEDAILRADLLHRTLVALSAKVGLGGRPSPCFTARDDSGDEIRGHRHAALLPLDLDGDGRMDHVLVHAPMGFDARAQTALANVTATWAANLPTIYVTLVGMGRPGDFTNRVPQAQSARIWLSSTPFVPARFLKERGPNSLEGQVRAELQWREIVQEPASIEVQLEGDRMWLDVGEFWQLWHRRTGRVSFAPAGGTGSAYYKPLGAGARVPRLSPKWRRFRTDRHDKGRAPMASGGIGLRLTFGQELHGPLTLGYGSHFGLGQFAPEVSASVPP